MENLFFFLATSFVLRIASPRFRRFVICPGCSTLLNSGDKKLHVRYTRDGDKLYFNEYAEDGVTYGMICVQMPAFHLLDEAESILKQYINRVRKPLKIACHLSMEIERTSDMLTIEDYWQDAAGLDWKIKGYTNGKILLLLYVKNIANTSVRNHDAFLNGARFSFVS
jgi:hypothetical protein